MGGYNCTAGQPYDARRRKVANQAEVERSAAETDRCCGEQALSGERLISCMPSKRRRSVAWKATYRAIVSAVWVKSRWRRR